MSSSKDNQFGSKLLIVGMLLASMALAVAILHRRLSAPAAQEQTADVTVPAPAPPSIRGKPAPDFALPNLDGATLHRADFKGKVLLVNFWATWCNPCLVEIPWFEQFQKQYGPQGLEVLGISMDDDKPAIVKRFVDEHKMTYPIVMGNDKTADAFGGIMGLPMTFLVDRDGKFYSIHRGMVNRDDVEDELRSLLESPKATASSESTSNASGPKS